MADHSGLPDFANDLLPTAIPGNHQESTIRTTI